MAFVLSNAPAIMVALAIIGAGLTWRHWRQLQRVWGAARWYEKLALLVCLLPLPGPADELVSGLVIARVLRRAAK